MKKGNKVTWYVIERKVGGGYWVDEGIPHFETLEEAQEELNFQREFFSDEKWRIAEYHGTIIYSRD